MTMVPYGEPIHLADPKLVRNLGVYQPRTRRLARQARPLRLVNCKGPREAGPVGRAIRCDHADGWEPG